MLTSHGSGDAIDIFRGQGDYDNTVLCHPFNPNIVYFGGVSLFRTMLTSGSTQQSIYTIQQNNTEGFCFLQVLNGAYAGGRLNAGASANNTDVEIRFGPGRGQKAHRFLVPDGMTSGVPTASFTYQDYVDVPFEVWDVTNNRQLMISFRDQDRNGVFNLLPASLNSPYLQQTREYLYVNNLDYAADPAPQIMVNGGHAQSLMYNIFPALANGATWSPDQLPESSILIDASLSSRLNASTITVADAYGDYDGKNMVNQTDKTVGVHSDQHYMLAINMNPSQQTFQILLTNDGGVFASNIGTAPGTQNGNWTFKGFSYNTSQYYTAVKRPGKTQYIGGTQDNGTWMSPPNVSPTAQTDYQFAGYGDGFACLWNYARPNEVLLSSQNGVVSRSFNNGAWWSAATIGLGTGLPFYTKLANSPKVPDRVFSVSKAGVFRSEDFAASWNLIPISEQFAGPSTGYLDVEVSAANPEIVWAGSGMSNAEPIRKLHVSLDGGKTFQPTNNYDAVPLGNITKIATHPAEPHTAYALFSFAHGPKILRTKDLGQTWEDITGFGTGSSSTNGFPDVITFCLYVRPDNPDIMWAGTEVGIVESLDGGDTWTMLENLPNVGVRDIRGMDNEIVIATFGRGIWTATVSDNQLTVYNPVLVGSGTAPDQSLILRLNAPSALDSLELLIDGKNVALLRNILPGMIDVKVENVDEGYVTLNAKGYSGILSKTSGLGTVRQIRLDEVKTSYFTNFNQSSDLLTEGMTITKFDAINKHEKKSLHSPHPYENNKEMTIHYRTPLKISGDVHKLFYGDIAVTEANDKIVIEASRNGIDWIKIVDPYDATFNSDWLSKYYTNDSPTRSNFVNHTIDLLSHFDIGDTVLVRMVMKSDGNANSWGWALDYMSFLNSPPDDEQFDIVPPEIVLSGTSPQKQLALRIHFPSRMDSLVVKVNSLYIKTEASNFNETADVFLEDITPGPKLITVTGYRNGFAYSSDPHSTTMDEVLETKSSFLTRFENLDGLHTQGLTSLKFDPSSKYENNALHTPHPYGNSSTYSIALKHPIQVSSIAPTIFLSQMVITEPGRDLLLVQATKNGLDWVDLQTYDASSNSSQWLSAYNNSTTGTREMFTENQVSLVPAFSTNDQVLIRMTLGTTSQVNSWGWAIQLISVQEIPLGSETKIDFNVYPNPSRGVFSVEYSIVSAGQVYFEIVNSVGKVVQRRVLVESGGNHTEEFNLSNEPAGVYSVVLKTQQGKKAVKVIVGR